MEICTCLHRVRSGEEDFFFLFFYCRIEQPDLDLNVATIHKHVLLWAMISKTKLIWSISHLEMSNLDLNLIIGFGKVPLDNLQTPLADNFF